MSVPHDRPTAVPFRCEGTVDPFTGSVEVRSVECEGMPEMEAVLRERLRSLRRWSLSLSKFGSFIWIVVLGTVLAGLYGALHDQLSYTIGPEYFTKNKFPRLGLEKSVEKGALTPRQGAAVVGITSAWWAGTLSAAILGLVGMIHAERAMFRRTCRALLLTLGVAMVVGLLGLGFGLLGLGDLIAVLTGRIDYFDGRFDHPTRVLAVQTMHGFSYFGGFLGLLIALADIRRVARPVYQSIPPSV